ncbi:MAG: hypothetical protein QNK24_06145 [Desulfuromusa sp.]|nr:hypothetical protein [Desulfuromusa sp.]
MHPAIYYPLQKIFGKYYRLAIHDDTEIVIEGYPRSGNTFSVVAFEQAQNRPVKIAHHLHIAAQAIAGTKRGIPVIILLRSPVDAISSLITREPFITINVALEDYIRFYKSVLPIKNKVLIARFEEVTSDFGGIIDRMNLKFNTGYKSFEHTKENVARVFSSLDDLETKNVSKLTDESKVARPSEHRKRDSERIKKELLLADYNHLLAIAVELYEKLASKKP